MTDYRKERKNEQRLKYISYAIVIGVMTGFNYLTKDLMKPGNNQIVKPIIMRYHLEPSTNYILNEVYNVKLCRKYYQADATCTRVIHSVKPDIKETL